MLSRFLVLNISETLPFNSYVLMCVTITKNANEIQIYFVVVNVAKSEKITNSYANLCKSDQIYFMVKLRLRKR